MISTICMIILNQVSNPEGNQLNRLKDLRSLDEIHHGQWACFLFLCNCMFAFPEEFIHVQQVVLLLNTCLHASLFSK